MKPYGKPAPLAQTDIIKSVSDKPTSQELGPIGSLNGALSSHFRPSKIGHSKNNRPEQKRTDQNKENPAAGPPSGVNQYCIFDGMTLPMTGRSTPAGTIYTPTASKNGLSAEASTPMAIAATIPTAADLKNISCRPFFYGAVYT